MKTRISLSIAAISLASTLVSCSSGEPGLASDDSDVDTYASRSAPAPEPTSSATQENPVPPGTGTVEAIIPAAPVASAPPAVAPMVVAVQNGPTKTDMTYVASTLDSHVAANGIPATDNWLEAITINNAKRDNATDIGFKLNDDGSYTLRGWNPNDPNYKDFNTSLEYHSVTGFKAAP